MARTTGASAHRREPPIVVDLDGTLIRADLFAEGALRFVFAAWPNLFRLLAWLLAGRANAKARLARAAPCDPAALPYDPRVLEWLRQERAKGRTLVLATASDEAEAGRVAGHLGLFDAVLATDGRVNLKSRRKAERLAALYPDGFVYAGNERADLPVWAAAEAAVVVNAPRGLEAAVRRRHRVSLSFPVEHGRWRAALEAIRPQQWAKNLLVFLPMLTAQGWGELAAWRGAALAFVAISATASSVYLVNDAADIDADRLHARKASRPFASGRLSPQAGLALAAALMAAGLILSVAVGVIWLVLAYLAASTTYTFWLKRKMLIDVFTLAGLYMVRILIGGQAAGYYVSSWLLAFSCFFFLSLALVKRVTEVEAVAARDGGDLARRGYRGSDGATLKMFGVGAAFVAALVLALYLQSPEVVARYREPGMLWALPALVVYWECRIWLMTSRGEVHDDPLVFAATDRISWVVAVVGALAFAAAALLPPNALPWG